MKRELGDRSGIATALSNLGMVAADQGDYEFAISLYEESMVLNRELKNMTGLTLTMHNLGGILVENHGDGFGLRSPDGKPETVKRIGDSTSFLFLIL